MARINGVNSDFELSSGQIQPVDPPPGQLFLKFYLCPYNQPNRLEPLNGASSPCEGTDDECPESAGSDPGHALILLHQEDGIKLATDSGNQIRLTQKRTRKNPPDPGRIILSPPAGGRVVIQNSSGTAIFADVSQNNIILQTTSGARILLKQSGDIELFTRKSTGTMTIHGNLQVTGTVNGTNIPPR